MSELGKPRGLAALSPEKRTEISSKGGKAAQAKGTAHRWTKEEAKEAGRLGGLASAKKRKEREAEETSNA